jgi:5-formyltetrahydrofolate cyclo-ligase
MDDLKQLRRNMRARRCALSAREQRASSEAMADRLVLSPLFLRSRRIAAYLCADGEMDPSPLLACAMAMGKRCFLPVLRAHPQRTLWFCEYRPGDPLLLNRFGIAEPSVRRRAPIPPWGLDLVLLPLVAFDGEGNRLGMGGGYYDRTFAYLHHRQLWRSPQLIGLAHDFQRVDRLPAQHWDVPLQGVATDVVFTRWR